MDPFEFAPLFVIGLFLGMLALLEIGRRIGIRRFADDPEGARAGIGPVEGAIFGLLGLLVAFTFSGAATRFDGHRLLIVEEANDVGTAYLRLDLLPTSEQPALREAFRLYVDSRLEAYDKLPDVEAAREELARSAALQAEIWRLAVAACQKKNDPAVTLLVLSALNKMIDITTTRTMSGLTHPPLAIFALLAVSALVSSLLAGYSMADSKTRSWLHVLGFALILSITVYIIIDIEYPRLGLIRIDAFDQVLRDVRESMK